MKRLNIPLKNVEERTIYQECADDFQDKTALGYIDKVVALSEKYEDFVPKNIEKLPKFEIKEGHDEIIKNVYAHKFARDGKVGRKYYDIIMANANGRCPICGGSKLKNLDHFLPQSEYPLLCVTPANLIPVCRDCNFDKGKYFNTNYYKLPFNPYFDDMVDTWLECTLNFIVDGTIEIEFRNGYDKSVDSNKWNKYETHLTVYDLGNTFSSKALEEIDNCKFRWQDLFLNCGKDDVLALLLESKKSFERYDTNSWRSALYRELVRKIDELSEWLANT